MGNKILSLEGELAGRLVGRKAVITEGKTVADLVIDGGRKNV